LGGGGGGLLDLAFPALDALDAGLAAVALPAWARLALYGALSGAVTMAVYRLVSDQAGIRALKARSRELQGRLRGAGDDLALTMRLTRENLAVSLRLLLRSLWPALAASLPVVAVIAWLATSWALPPPAPGTPVPLTPAPAGAALAAEPPGALLPPPTPGPLAGGPAGGPAAAVLRWPAPDAPVALKDATGAVVYEGLGARPPAATLHKRVWWNALLGNPAGYLPEGAALEEVRLGLPGREVLPFGPGWARGYELTYFAAVVAVSLLLKVLFRIA
jgi:hypothetical protein